MGAKHAQFESGAGELASSTREEAPATQTRTPGASAFLIFLVAGLFAASALTLLWLAVRTIRWLLGG